MRWAVTSESFIAIAMARENGMSLGSVASSPRGMPLLVRSA
jgi:hypothetical protein